jgi:RNA polymerase sigma-B factor
MKLSIGHTIRKLRRSRDLTQEELAEALGVPEEDILEALETGGALNVVSLDYTPESDEEAAPLDNYLGMEDQGYSSFENNDAVSRAMALLNDRQKDIIRMRYFENMSQREVDDELGISQMTISREERKALEIMRSQI